MTLRRGFEIKKKGQKVIISEDVVTTGKSSLEEGKTYRRIRSRGSSYMLYSW